MGEGEQARVGSPTAWRKEIKRRQSIQSKCSEGVVGDLWILSGRDTDSIARDLSIPKEWNGVAIVPPLKGENRGNIGEEGLEGTI